MDNVIRATVSLIHSQNQDAPRNDFYVNVCNPTPFHADFTIKTRLYAPSLGWVSFPEAHYYGGRPWTLQAMETFNGNLNLGGFLRRAFGVESVPGAEVNPSDGMWLEFSIGVSAMDGVTTHKVCYSFKDGRWLREPGAPLFA